MYRIGEFSTLSKTTIKTLHYYEREGLLVPSYVDLESGYRFYETKQLLDLSKIIALRQVGLSIQNIKAVLNGEDFEIILKKRRKELQSLLTLSWDQLSKIECLLEGKEMKYEAIIKELPDYVVYYKEGVIADYSKITEFVLASAAECQNTNPDIQCVSPDYCYINYLDGEYKEKDITIRYAQAVTKEGIANETIHFEKLKPVQAVCVYHKGDYSKLGEAYSFIMKWIEDNGYQMIELPRERYIDGIWNKENVEDWITEIQVPIQK